MALVFISHAHGDEALAQRIAALLGAALGLSAADFFLSSEAGHGVEPAASIRASIVNELHNVPVLAVLLTPKAAASPWVWLEAGDRLGCADKAPPIFIVPSERFVPLLAPVADLRCLRLDNDGELHELVRAAGNLLHRAPLDFLTYKPALQDLLKCSAQAYSRSAETRARLWRWTARYGIGLVLVITGIGLIAYGGWRRAPGDAGGGAANERDAAALLEWNDTLARSVSKFLVLKGRVTSARDGVHGATVMVSREEVQDASACQEPACTKTTTTTEGEFTINLTRIQANNGESIVLTVVKPGFALVSKQVDVDVRAMDAGTAPQPVIELPSAPSR